MTIPQNHERLFGKQEFSTRDGSHHEELMKGKSVNPGVASPICTYGFPLWKFKLLYLMFKKKKK